MTAAGALAGVLRLRPGRPPPNIENNRLTWARGLGPGRRASQLPDLLASVFALCGGTHRIAAQLAIAAACGRRRDGPDDARLLQRDTLAEQLRRIWIDWPAALGTGGPGAADLAALRDGLLAQRHAEARSMPIWLAENALGIDATLWLDRWIADPAAWLADWCKRAATLPARLLNACRATACSLATIVPQPLDVARDAAGLAALGEALHADAAFARQPAWRGLPVETGPWTRANEPDPARYANAWLRLGARLAEVVRLALPDTPRSCGAAWLRQGSLALAPGEGLGWCEMARGLLVHRVEVDDPHAVDPLVQACDVLAPTEWNFHPTGPVACAIAGLATGNALAARLVAAAYDPCVAIEIESEPCTR